MDEARYYVRRQGRVEGPWPFGKLCSEVALRKLGKHHELSEDGNTWKRASEVEGLFSSTSARKHVRHSATSELAEPAVPRAATAAGAEELEVELAPVEDAGEPAVWYYAVSDVQSGPITTRQLVAAVEEGRIALDSLVWREGFGDWQPLQGVADITSQFDHSWRYVQPSKVAVNAFASTSSRSPYAGSGATPGSKNKIAAGLLAIFLGGLGIHKFYLGYIGPGLVFLLTNTIGWFVTIFLLGLPNFALGIIALIEGIIYLTKPDEEFEQTYVVGRKPWF